MDLDVVIGLAQEKINQTMELSRSLLGLFTRLEETYFHF